MSRMLAMDSWIPAISSVSGSKNIHEENGEGEKNACMSWWVDGLFIWEDIA